MEHDIKADRVTHTDQNDVWVYDWGKTLTLYNERFVEKKKLLLSSSLEDMVLTASHDIIATDYDNKRLIKISPAGYVSTLCSTAPLKPRGICINNRGHIVVGGKAVSLRAWPIKLVIYFSDGSAVLQKIENDEHGKPLFIDRITQVKQNGKGDYVVADDGRVVCVNSWGRFRWDYNVGLLDIYGIICDRYDNVIIAEYLNKILLLSSEGKLVTTLLTRDNGIYHPWSLSIDTHGQLWIAQEKGVKVFKYLK